MYFELIIYSKHYIIFYMASLLETEVEVDHGDDGLIILNSREDCPLQVVYNVR